MRGRTPSRQSRSCSAVIRLGSTGKRSQSGFAFLGEAANQARFAAVRVTEKTVPREERRQILARKPLRPAVGPPRRGATLIETAISLALFITLLLGTVDLSYGVFRYHVLAHAARQIARHAVVHGSRSDRLGVWGPAPVSLRAEDPDPIAESGAPSLVGWELSEVQIDVDWIDGGNEADKGHRVRVQLRAPYQPIMTFVLANRTIDFTAASTMRIAH